MHAFAAKRRYWKQQIADWESSGKTGKEWSAERGHNYATFLYWKNRYPVPIRPEDFLELSPEKASSIHIQYQGVRIEIDVHFHTETLSKLLATIKSALC